MPEFKSIEPIEVVPGDTVDLPECIPQPSISITVDKPFYGYKKAKVDLVSVIMDIAKCSEDAASDIWRRAIIMEIAKCSVDPDKGRILAFGNLANKPRGEVIVTLEIPAGAKCVIGVDHAICRCDSARVVDIRIICESHWIIDLAKKILSDQHVAVERELVEGGPKLQTAHTNPARGERMTYSSGGFVKPVFDFNDDPSVICASGIHFFLHKKDAIEYFM